jgi:hypothetical protein
MTMPPGTAPEQPEEPEQPDDDARADEDAVPTALAPVLPAPVPSAPAVPVPPTQSREDTDVGWGEYPPADDNDRLLRDRPPHWNNG